MKISRLGGSFAGIAIALLVLASVTLSAWSQGATGVNIIILLRVAGESGALPQLRTCLTSKLSQLPDVEIADPAIDRVRFVVDVVAARGADKGIYTSLVLAETFPMEQFRPRIKEGEEADALLGTMRYYTLLRLHDVVPGRSISAVCAKMVTEISDKVLSKEYTDRDD
jgi:hypothetical protein